MNVLKNQLLLFTSCALLVTVFESCESNTKENVPNQVEETLLMEAPADIQAPENMVWIPGRVFTQGAVEADELALEHEKPAHQVAVDGFFMDQTEVTNQQFQEFVTATGYQTIAERPISWEELKQQLPEGTPKLADSLLQPGSLIFNRAVTEVTNMVDISQWWEWVYGVNWKHPEGPGSDLRGKENFPVVHIAYEDALAYCEWANRRLPTEAEWELAALGENPSSIYTWGNDDIPLCANANTWQGVFPTVNKPEDKYEYVAPVGAYPANSSGLHDMAGNVWEWTLDWYNTNYYSEIAEEGILKNPTGAEASYNPRNPYQPERVMKGGSFLCHKSYCASYRISARMGMAPDSGSDHVGFRTVVTPDMLEVGEEVVRK